jgi:glycogen synthase
MRHAMRCDFSWQGPMTRYFEVYEEAEHVRSAA